jgi:hypothetical protein
MSKKTITLPNLDEVARELKHISGTLSDDEASEWEDEGGFPVRLQLYEDGDWAIRQGSPDWDTDHHGFWGAASVPGGKQRFDAHDIAMDLIREAEEGAAERGFEIRGKVTKHSRSR